MVCTLKLKHTEFKIRVYKKGGRTVVFKNGKYYFAGQYFPERKCLWAPQFKFEAVLKLIERFINSKIQSQDIIFPYYG